MANVITNKTEQYRKGKTHDSLQLNESKQANHKLAVSYDIRPGNEVAPICSTNRRALHGAYPQAASNYSNICECDIQQYRIVCYEVLHGAVSRSVESFIPQSEQTPGFQRYVSVHPFP